VWSAPKSLLVDADPVLEWEGNTFDAVLAWRRGSTGVIEQGMRSRVRQEPGRPYRLRRRMPVWEPGEQNPGPSPVVLAGDGSEDKEHRRYR
jgi:hypothetical protein